MHVRARDEDRDPEVIELSRVVFPVEISPQTGFLPDDPATWPRVDGRLEWVGGRLLYMPPSGRAQSQTVADVVNHLSTWGQDRRDLSIQTNEAGMKLGDDVRAADAAVWRIDDLPADADQLPRKPPLLAIEVAGRDDSEAVLRSKAAWYLEHGVITVWILLPESREAIVLEHDLERRCSGDQALPPPAALAGLSPRASELFCQVTRWSAT